MEVYGARRMPSVLIVKNEMGKLEGFGQRGAKTYAKFLGAVSALEVGEMLSFDYRVPRAPRFHRLHFVMLSTVYESQEVLTDDYKFRKWAEVGAGHCDFLPGAQGELIAVPRSIDYTSLDDVEFGDVHSAVKSFFRGEHARRYLWPHLSEVQTWEMVEALLREFET
ncbi:MAG: hypothetical protein A3E01_08395 [Gammaproteobacteria bacterium RIFCSPHIGHO2_12_FULL_63_22]|nr:MAG: hypothetical protein A3E01_08395 [Gammaproteobacteria bacterium RIFCSPHIGHO2_12_FULL_63_22]